MITTCLSFRRTKPLLYLLYLKMTFQCLLSLFLIWILKGMSLQWWASPTLKAYAETLSEQITEGDNEIVHLHLQMANMAHTISRFSKEKSDVVDISYPHPAQPARQQNLHAASESSSSSTSSAHEQSTYYAPDLLRPVNTITLRHPDLSPSWTDTCQTDWCMPDCSWLMYVSCLL